MGFKEGVLKPNLREPIGLVSRFTDARIDLPLAGQTGMGRHKQGENLVGDIPRFPEGLLDLGVAPRS